MRYKPFGEVRYAWKNDTLNASPAYALTRYTFTGQYSYMDDPSTPASEGFGLMFYNARMYDPALGRFTSADTIVPGGVQGYDRYAYVNNNPIRYNDPTGHMCSDPEDPTPSCEGGGRPPPSTNNGGGGSGSGGGGGGGEEEEEGISGTDPDLCKMYGEGCGDGDKSLKLNSPTPIPDFDECNPSSIYICGGDGNMGFVYNPITNEIYVWYGGMENMKYATNINSSPDSVDLHGFMNSVALNDGAKTTKIWAGVGVWVGMGSLLAQAASGVGWVTFGLTYAGTVAATAAYVQADFDVVNSEKDAIKYWNGISE